MSISLYAAALLLATALISGYLAVYVWHRRHLTAGRYFALCMGAVGWWAFAAMMAIRSATLADKIVWTNLEFIGIALVPLSWFIFALEYSGRRDRATPWLKIALSVPAALLQVVVWTNDYHRLFRTHVWLDNTGLFPTLGAHYGVLFWVHTAYAYLLLLAGAYLLFNMPRGGPPIYRRQRLSLILVLLLPWTANVITLFGAGALSFIDLTPFAFMLSGMIASWALLRHRLFDLVPIALEGVVENMASAVIVLDPEWRVVRINPSGATLLQSKADALVGKRLADILPAAYLDFIPRLERVDTAQESVVVPQSSYEAGADRHELTLDMRYRALRDRRGNLLGRLITLQDITRRVLGQLALRQYGDRLRVLHAIDQAILAAQSPETIADAVLEQIHNLVPAERASVLVLDADGRARLLALAARPPLTGNGTVWRKMLAAGDLKLHDILALDVLDGSEQAPYFERRLYAEGVRSCLVIPLILQEKIVGMLNLESAQPRAFSTEHADIAVQLAVSLAVALENARLLDAIQQELAERKAVEAALRESEAVLREKADDLASRNAELDAFAHTVAHDLKMPLSLMIGYTSFIEAGEVDDDIEQLRWCAQAIGQSARKMNSIIDELLLLASFRKTEDVALVPLNSARIVEEVLVRFTDLLEQRRAEIVLPEAWPSALGHAPWVEEVWANYISNALKYGGAPPRIELGAEVLGGEGEASPLSVVRFWVRDNGEGLTPEQQARLFVPFERLDQTRAQGHGLGLSIVQRIAERLGGAAGVESSPGAGSTFYFTLPGAGDAAQPES